MARLSISPRTKEQSFILTNGSASNIVKLENILTWPKE